MCSPFQTPIPLNVFEFFELAQDFTELVHEPLNLPALWLYTKTNSKKVIHSADLKCKTQQLSVTHVFALPDLPKIFTDRTQL